MLIVGGGLAAAAITVFLVWRIFVWVRELRRRAIVRLYLEAKTTMGRYLTEIQLDILRSWAEQTPQVQKAYLFGSYAKGEAHGRSDVDVAVMASDGNWTALAGEWE